MQDQQHQEHMASPDDTTTLTMISQNLQVIGLEQTSTTSLRESTVNDNGLASVEADHHQNHHHVSLEPEIIGFDPTKQHITTGGINPVPKRPAGKKSGNKRRRTFELVGGGHQQQHSGKTFKRLRKSGQSGSVTTSKKNKVEIADDAPLRFVNPLLELPEFPITAAPLDISRVPNGAELHVYTELAFHRPDTYSLAYYARLLGFAVPDEPDGMEFKSLDPDKVPLLSSKILDPFLQLPPLGNPCLQPFKRCHSYGDEDDQYILDYMDPVYLHLLTSPTGTANPYNISPSVPTNISTDCVDYARECGIISEEWTFKFCLQPTEARIKDKVILEHFSTSSTGTFLILAMRNNVPEMYILYQFQSIELESTLSNHNRTFTLDILRIGGMQSNDDIASSSSSSSSLKTNDHGESNQSKMVITWPAVEPYPTVDTSKQENESVVLVLVALALEHGRANGMPYALSDAPMSQVQALETYFRMARRAPLLEANPESGHVPLVCDLKKYSFKYAFLLKKHGLPISHHVNDSSLLTSSHDRLLVRMPTVEEVEAAIMLSAKGAMSQRAHKKQSKKLPCFFSSADEVQRQGSFTLRVRITSDYSTNVRISTMHENGNEEDLISRINFPLSSMPSFDIFRVFPIPAQQREPEVPHGLLSDLIAKQQELSVLEGSMEGKLRLLLMKVVQERRDFESPTALTERSKEKQILQENERILQRRKEMDLAWQKQLEQDMDAVCDICGDGEVTPDNQILFCEACNVAVHQICYGIEEVPAGDYFCVACRYFNRERMSDIIARVKRDPNAPKFSPSPLPICCELCPRKQGSFIRTDISNQLPKVGETVVVPKWVHVVCAKWQGLNFVEKNKPEVVEDVTELKLNFRRLDLRCALCLGERGAFNPCRVDGCKKSLHVTCARASGLCEVIHGENSRGAVLDNPWTLLCQDHSNIATEDIPKDAVPVDQLIRAANEFPQEPKPDPTPRKPKPFNKLTGTERTDLLDDPSYERELIVELLTKRLQGVHCEVCDVCDDDGKRLKRCECGAVFCDSCALVDVDGFDDSRNFTCVACRYVIDKVRQGQAYTQPRCLLCSQKSGWLREAEAVPFKASQFKKKPKELRKTFFARDKLWCHTVCIYWNGHIHLDGSTGKVNLTNVIMTHGKGFINSGHVCALCGETLGMKAPCDHEGCHGWGQKKSDSHFHVTCAREAGLEVDFTEANREAHFYVRCYRHVGNAFNVRAKLEDLIEIEKKRAGKRLEKSRQLTMGFPHASRLLNGAIRVMKTLGWAWRWAEWWVEYGSSWEPLLEENQDEKTMSKEELRIVDSTPESRCVEARRCRLAPLGAALRNRAYDVGDGFDNEALHRALRSLLHARALVGPLQEFEIDFFVEWLGRAYRSKSKLLGFGDDKVDVAASSFCLHQDDKSPKFELGNRILPGKEILSDGEIFEQLSGDVDDFLKPTVQRQVTNIQGVEKNFAPKHHTPVKHARSLRSSQEKDQTARDDRNDDTVEQRLERMATRDAKEDRSPLTESSGRPNGYQPSDADAFDSECNSQHHDELRSGIEAKEEIQVATSQQFRRSVLGGNAHGTFYYEGTSSPPLQSLASNTKKRKPPHKQKEKLRNQYTPDEATLPLSVLLGSTIEVEDRPEVDFDAAHNSNDCASEGNKRCESESERTKNSKDCKGLSQHFSAALLNAGAKSSSTDDDEGDEVVASDALLASSIAELERSSFDDTPQKRGRRRGKILAAQSLFYEAEPSTGSDEMNILQPASGAVHVPCSAVGIKLDENSLPPHK